MLLPTLGRFAFRSDPFGLWQNNKLHIFVEAFDYRSLKGWIELLIYDAGFNLLDTRRVLSEPWHLSYPFVFQADGQSWMLPEARRSGRLTLYRARDFPTAWEPAASIDVAAGALDATPMFSDERWWLFYALRGAAGGWELRVAFADQLMGPWRSHPLNPVRVGFAARPAGTPVAGDDGSIDLPIQDGSETYGGSVRRLRIRRLDEHHFEADDQPWLGPTAALHPAAEGLHTLSAAGHVTLIDFKRVDRSLAGALVRQRGSLARRLRRWRA